MVHHITTSWHAVLVLVLTSRVILMMGKVVVVVVLTARLSLPVIAVAHSQNHKTSWHAVLILVVNMQFSAHDGPRQLLLSTAREESTQLLQESSPSDFFWAAGVDGTGCNHLGRLLMQVREELQSGAHVTNNVPPTVAALT